MSTAAPREQDRARRAWERLDTGLGVVATTPRREGPNKKSEIHFITLSDGARIVAKLGSNDIVDYERQIYQRILPQLPVPTPNFYGAVAEDAERGWIFLEDIAGERASPLDPEHRRLTGAWLGDAHAAMANPVEGELTLPSTGPVRFLRHLISGRDGIRRNLDNPAFDRSHRHVLDQVLDCCDRLESAWDDLTAFSDSLPQSFVHADYRPKNVHVRSRAGQREVLAMDWETSGWGPCAVDLAPWHRDPNQPFIDLSVYAERIVNGWPGLTRDTLERAALLGQVFRQLAGIDWAVPSLPYPWPEKPIGRLRVYGEVLADALRRPPWIG